MKSEDITNPTRRRFLQSVSSTVASAALPGNTAKFLTGTVASTVDGVASVAALMSDEYFLSRSIYIAESIKCSWVSLPQYRNNIFFYRVLDSLAQWSNLSETERRLVVSSPQFKEAWQQSPVHNAEITHIEIHPHELITDDGLINITGKIVRKIGSTYPGPNEDACISDAFADLLNMDDMKSVSGLTVKERLQMVLSFRGSNVIDNGFHFDGKADEIYRKTLREYLGIDDCKIEDSLKEYADYMRLVEEYGEKVGGRVFAKASATIGRCYGMTAEAAAKFGQKRLQAELDKPALFIDIQRTESEGLECQQARYRFKLANPPIRVANPFAMIKLGLVVLENFDPANSNSYRRNLSSETFGLKWQGDEQFTFCVRRLSSFDNEMAQKIQGSKYWYDETEAHESLGGRSRGLGDLPKPVRSNARLEYIDWQSLGFRL